MQPPNPHLAPVVQLCPESHPVVCINSNFTSILMLIFPGTLRYSYSCASSNPSSLSKEVYTFQLFPRLVLFILCAVSYLSSPQEWIETHPNPAHETPCGLVNPIYFQIFLEIFKTICTNPLVAYLWEESPAGLGSRWSTQPIFFWDIWNLWSAHNNNSCIEVPQDYKKCW